jgi:Fe-S-cluster formation regulator IscX/YfhJ
MLSFRDMCVKCLAGIILLLVSGQVTAQSLQEAIAAAQDYYNRTLQQAEDFIKEADKAYAEYIEANSALWTPEVDNAAYEKMKDVQALTLQFVALRDEIAKNEEAIQKSGASAPSILAPYTEFVAKVDLTWTPDVDLEKLHKHIQMQQQSQKMIDNNAKIVENSAKIREEGAVHVDLITAYNMYIGSDIVWTPEVDVASTEKILDVQQKTLTFVQLRNTVVENDVYLKEKSSAGKGLYKLYTTYRKTAVLTWTSEVDMTAIETLIGIQEDCKTMLAYDDIKGICKAIKKAKIKDVVTAIQNYKK